MSLHEADVLVCVFVLVCLIISGGEALGSFFNESKKRDEIVPSIYRGGRGPDSAARVIFEDLEFRVRQLYRGVGSAHSGPRDPI